MFNALMRRLIPVSSSSFDLELLEPRLLLSGDGLLNTNPFGVATSAESRWQYPNYLPIMADAGVEWVRMPALWNAIQPERYLPVAEWNFSALDGYIATAEANNIHINGTLLYNAAWASQSHTLPVDYLDEWGTYVYETIDHVNSDIDYWEIWNEAPNFTGGGSASDYAQVVAVAYDQGKAADPNAQFGLSIARNDLQFMRDVINAGAADHFDFIAIHPYEVAGTLDDGQEAAFMNIAPRIREMLQEINPAKADVPIWFTEVGTALNGGATEQDQADDLVKIYTMGIAQGVQRIEWFEALESNYDLGLLLSLSNPTLAYDALDNFTEQLGNDPQYLGWTMLNSQNYAFVFQGAGNTVMVAWAPPGETNNVSFGQTVAVMNPVTGSTTNTSSYNLMNSPIFVLGVPTSLVNAAKANIGKLIPSWGGYDAPTQSVYVNMGADNDEFGLHHLNADSTSSVATVNGEVVRSAGENRDQKFTIDPRFLPYDGNDIAIEVVVQREGSQTAGFNLKYESLTGDKSIGWNTVPTGTQWHTLTFNITDALFVTEMGFNFRLDSDSTQYSQYYIKSVTVTNNEYVGGLNIDVNGTPIVIGSASAYDSSQDGQGGPTSAIINASGDTVTLLGNAWKRWGLSYNVTANTKLQFTVNAADVGEIMGIALDNDTNPTNSRRIFRFGGSDAIYSSLDSWSYRIFPTHIANSGAMTYTVDVSDYFTGSVSYLGLIVDDDANASGNAMFSNLQLYEDAVTLTIGIAGVPTALGDPVAYGSQDGQGGLATNATVDPAGDAVILVGNAWKRWGLNYTVTADTVLQFTVDSADAGEILGIALDSNTDPLAGRRAFRFGGSDVDDPHDSWSWRIIPTYTAGGGEVTYTIDVGDYFTGSVAYLGLIADDDADASASATFSNIKLFEAPSIVLGTPSAYGTQDGAGSSAAVSGDGSSVTLTSNAWKRWGLSYTVTQNTMLRFTVDSADTGEILGITLDNDTNPTNYRRAFRFGGSDVGGDYATWGWRITPTYIAASGAATYTINVGNYFTGSVSYLGLFIDDDADGSGTATFSDIRIYEA